MQKISENEVRTDLLHVRDEVPSKSEKIIIGMKYGLPKEKCSRVENVINRIYEYLRELRKTKSSYTDLDLRDFYNLINGESKYDKLESFLMLETGKFIKCLLDRIYTELQRRSTLSKEMKDNLETINIKNRNNWYLSSNDKIMIERYQSIKKYYDKNYSINALQLQNVDRIKQELENKLIEDTYEIRLMLEDYLVNFINECYDTYIYGTTEWKQLYDLQTYYTKLRDKENTKYSFLKDYTDKDSKLHKYNNYITALHFILLLYTYFKLNDSYMTKEKRIELSIDYFNKAFDKFINKQITRTLLGKDVTANDIEVKGLEKAEFGYYFTIDYKENKTLYVNFNLHHQYQDTSDMDKLCDKDFMYKNLYPTVNYIMSVTAKPYKEKRWINESFDYNQTNFALDNFDDEELIGLQTLIIKNLNYTTRYLAIMENFVDMGLPSGTLWAKYNLGVDKDNLSKKQDWIGNYYAWGEVNTKDVYNWAHYKWNINNPLKKKELEKKYNRPLLLDHHFMTKYCGNKDYCVSSYDCKNLLDNNDDAAYVNNVNKDKYQQWMPTKGLCEELILNCNIKYVTDYNNVKKLNGILFTSKLNRNTIFFPFTGYRSLSKKPNIINNATIIWTANNNTWDIPTRAYAMLCVYWEHNLYDVEVYTYRRDYGHTIRPVLKLTDLKESFDFNKNFTLDDFNDNEELVGQQTLTITDVNNTTDYLKWNDLVLKFYKNFTKIMHDPKVRNYSGKGLLKAYIKDDCNLTKEDLQEIARLSKKFNKKYIVNGELDLIIKFVSEIDPKCDLNWLDVSGITNMRAIFLGTDFNGDVSEWDVSNVTNMNFIFANSKFNGDLSKWNMRNIESVYAMFFNNKRFNKDISNWNISNIKIMSGMFLGSNFNKPLDKWDVSNVTDMSRMFAYSKFTQDISNWNISNNCSIFNMFEGSKNIPKENMPKKARKWYGY